jgi:hypothetical protein
VSALEEYRKLADEMREGDSAYLVMDAADAAIAELEAYIERLTNPEVARLKWMLDEFMTRYLSWQPNTGPQRAEILADLERRWAERGR